MHEHKSMRLTMTVFTAPDLGVSQSRHFCRDSKRDENNKERVGRVKMSFVVKRLID